jgi:hypothetical protein
MSLSRPIQCYHPHADPICADGTFKNFEKLQKLFPNLAFFREKGEKMPEILKASAECSIKNEINAFFLSSFHNFRKNTSLMTTPCYRPHVLCIARLKPWKTQIWKKRGRSALLTFILLIF